MANYGGHTPEEMEAIGVYIITAPSGNKYVGVTGVSFKERWSNHIRDLRGNRHKCKGLQRAYAKYGEDELEFSIKLSYSFQRLLDDESFEQELLRFEQSVWDNLKESGTILYNGRPTGTGSVFHTEESKAKIKRKAIENARKHQAISYAHFIEMDDKIVDLIEGGESWAYVIALLDTDESKFRRYRRYRVEYLGLPPLIKPKAKIAQSSRESNPKSFSANYMKEHNLTREQFSEAVKEHWKVSHSKTITAEHFGITIKEVSFICNLDGRGPGLQRTHVRFHEKLNRGYSDCPYCLDSGVEINMVVPTAEELRRLYFEDNKSIAFIALEYDITKAKVQQLLYTYGIRRE